MQSLNHQIDPVNTNFQIKNQKEKSISKNLLYKQNQVEAKYNKVEVQKLEEHLTLSPWSSGPDHCGEFNEIQRKTTTVCKFVSRKKERITVALILPDLEEFTKVGLRL